MDKFATLEPTRLYGTSSSKPFSKSTHVNRNAVPLIGRLPVDLHLLILSYLPIPDFPAYARCCRSTAQLARDDRVWQPRWSSFAVAANDLSSVLDDLETKTRGRAASIRAAAPPTLAVESLDDEFGDFASGNTLTTYGAEMGDFVGGTVDSYVPPTPAVSPASPRSMYIRAHNLLKPCTAALSSPPHQILTALSAHASPSLRQQAKLLHLLSLFLSPRIQPLRAWPTLHASLRTAMDRFDANLLAAFDGADGKGDEDAMREAAESSWELWDGRGDWEMGKVWAEKREIFYEQGKWKPLDNVTEHGDLNFDAMDEFMADVMGAIHEHGARAVRVFPAASRVLLGFAERVSNEVVGEYITPLLTRAREISNEIYLKATAAAFREAWRIVDVVIQVGGDTVSRTQAEDVVYQMFELNMDEYLDEEVESVKQAFELICRDWEKQMSEHTATTAAAFLGSRNPAQMKRNVLASFRDVLLMPVTIVPRAVGAALTTGGTAAAQGIAMLNPQRWGGGQTQNAGYSNEFEKEGMVFEIGDADDDEKEAGSDEQEKGRSASLSSTTASLSSTAPTTASTSSKLELLLSLDTALELIHASREALKRVETFAGYPGHYGHRVRDTIEELFILLLQAVGERHIGPGFAQATEQMTVYRPAEHEGATSVAPLLQFFELVHIGDTIQSMVQVYFDKELAPHIDRTDFLNGVVREKKRFENALDDSVAAGLNAGTEVLMNQVEHIIQTLTPPRAYYPISDALLELGPTAGCTSAIECLKVHCRLLRGSTSKEVLEVFYQEVGIRLIAILQKHIKRQIISLTGGFQVIADLNAYYAFIASLKVSSVTEDFSYLKMLGHVYVVEDAKDLAQIVRDVTRYGGAYRPEDVYEFIQRRSDWKKIEKTVDKTMYNLSFKEDCVVC
ncbi:hypothetical protein PLICRDRAFT_104834 [Plicaturopsis crispa FD-325 SS-3]|nr:hypothetical protein PLICRDRAFT_104834 [Plicaturopsis crispa FD-325 SS-3]